MKKFLCLFCFVFAVMLLISVNTLMAVYIPVPVPNGSFEAPADGKHNMWDAGTNAKGTFTDVPYWTSDYPAYDSGVASEWSGYTDGVYSGYLCGKETGQTKDPSVWQILNYTIKENDQFLLQVDAANTWTEDSSLPAHLQMSLFYVDGVTRTVIATNTVTLDGSQGTPAINLLSGSTTSWRTYILDSGVLTTTPPVGSLLGIELYNPSQGRSWIGIDNVKLVPEPATWIMLVLGAMGIAFYARRK